MAESDFTAGNRLTATEIDGDSPIDETLMSKLKERDNEAIEAAPPALSVGTAELKDNEVTQLKLAASSVGTPELKTATGVASGTVTISSDTDVTLNDYSFFPNIQHTPTNPVGEMSIHCRRRSDINDTLGTFTIFNSSSFTRNFTVRWRYITASDDPAVYVLCDDTGKITGVWMSDDPLPDGKMGLEAEGQTSILVPRIDLGKLLTGIPAVKISAGKEKSTTPDKEPFRIMWEAFKNPADEIIKRAKIVGGKLEAR